MSGGFLNNFAYGASQELKNYGVEQDKERLAKADAEAQADARIREKVAEVDPMAELYKRQKDIDAAEEDAKQTAKVQRGLGMVDSFMNGTTSSDTTQPTTPTDTTAPTPTIGTPTASPTTPVGMSPFGAKKSTVNLTPDEHYDAIQKATTGKAVADLVGNKEASAAFDTQIQLHKTELDRTKRNQEDNKASITSADGVNVPDDILKDAAKNTTAGHATVYHTGSLQRPMDPDIAAKEEDIAANVHAPLAASYMAANPSTKEVSSVIKAKTLSAAQNVATIESPDAPIADKQKAVLDFQSYLKDTYGNYSQKQIAADNNLHHVVNAALVDKMNQIAKAESTPAQPTTSSTTQTSPTPKVVGTYNPATGKIE